MLGRSELVKMDKMVKSQKVDYWLEKSKFDFDLIGQNDQNALGLS